MPTAETPSPDALEPDEPVPSLPQLPAPLLRLRDGLPHVVETEAGLAEVCAAMRAAAPARSRSTPSARPATATPRAPT